MVEPTAPAEPTAPVAAVPTIAAVSVKLPPFWPQDPKVWFVQVEAQFATRGATAQKTKFDYVISSLSPEIAMEVRNLLLKPPAENPYDTRKAQLIKRTVASEQRKLQQLLRRMQQLLGDKLGAGTDANSFLCELFLQRLPPNVRMVLASANPATTLENLTDMADKIMEVSAPTVAALSTPRVDDSEVKLLHEQVSRLADLVASLPRANRSRHCSSSRNRPPPPPPPPANTPPPSQPPTQDTLCWYHAKFGDDARKCRDPCSWGQENS